jgi:hypothetical protein
MSDDIFFQRIAADGPSVADADVVEAGRAIGM